MRNYLFCKICTRKQIIKCVFFTSTSVLSKDYLDIIGTIKTSYCRKFSHNSWKKNKTCPSVIFCRDKNRTWWNNCFLFQLSKMKISNCGYYQHSYEIDYFHRYQENNQNNYLNPEGEVNLVLAARVNSGIIGNQIKLLIIFYIGKKIEKDLCYHKRNINNVVWYGWIG